MDLRRRALEHRIELASESAEIGHARSFVRGVFHGCDPDLVADLTLIVSELVSNAVEHGSGAVVVEAESGEFAAVVRVASHGAAPHVPPVSEWAIGPDRAASGRGLGIVARLATTIDVDHGGDTLVTTVTREH